MLKFSLLILSAIMFPAWHPIYMTMCLLSIVCLKHLYFHISSFSILSSMFIIDNLSSVLILLTLWTSFLMMKASNMIFEKKKNTPFFMMMLNVLLLILLLAFSVNNLMMFYILFEASLLPTMIIIMGWGYQPERINASIYLLLYTVTASLPLLSMISMMFHNQHTLFFLNLQMSPPINMTLSYALMMTLAFLVKLPLYISHLWLPKAHVEAPVAGSMILAGILLKLGAYGIMRLMSIQNNVFSTLNLIIMSISLWGMVMTALICLRQHDLKSLIAYSSVGHMALTLLGLLFSLKWGWEGAVMMMVAHGLASAGLFSLANSYYEIINTRSLFLTKGMSALFPIMSLWWFCMSIANMGAPPSINLMGEIMLLMSAISSSIWTSLFLALAMFLAAAYSLVLYTSIHHGSPTSSYNPMFTPITRHSLVSISFLVPVFLMFLSPQIISSLLF